MAPGRRASRATYNCPRSTCWAGNSDHSSSSGTSGSPARNDRACPCSRCNLRYRALGCSSPRPRSASRCTKDRRVLHLRPERRLQERRPPQVRHRSLLRRCPLHHSELLRPPQVRRRSAHHRSWARPLSFRRRSLSRRSVPPRRSTALHRSRRRRSRSHRSWAAHHFPGLHFRRHRSADRQKHCFSRRFPRRPLENPRGKRSPRPRSERPRAKVSYLRSGEERTQEACLSSLGQNR